MMTHRKSRAENIFISSEPPESLTESEELLSAFFKSSNIGLAILDSDFRYLAVNRVLAEINGIAPQDHLGKTVREILGDVGEFVERQLAQVVKTRHGLKFEVSGKIPSREPIEHWVIDTFPVSTLQDSAMRIGLIVYEATAPTVLDSPVQHLDGKLRQETKRLQMLTDVVSLLSSNWDVARLFPRMSARLRRVLCQEFASFALHDAGTGLLVHQATDFPFSKGLVPALHVSSSETPAGRSMQERKPMTFSKEQLQGFDDEVAKGLLAEGLQSLCCVPLLRPKGPLGVLLLGSTSQTRSVAKMWN